MAEGNSSKPPGDLPRGLIGRKGIPTGRGARLPSIGKPRDLTLGGAPKRVFTPNIPAKRDKSQEKKETVKEPKKKDEDKSKTGSNSKGRTSDNSRGRGRGRGRGRVHEFIQSHSIFEQGPSEKANRGPSYSDGGGGGGGGGGLKSGGGGGGGGGGGSGSKLSIKKERTDEETKQVLDYLLRDDFIDSNVSVDKTLVPVQLPLCKLELEDVKNERVQPSVHIKEEPVDEDVEMKTPDPKSKSSSIPYTRQIKEQSCQELFTTLTDTDANNMLFFQFPDTMPGVPAGKGKEAESGKSTDTKEKDDKSKKIETCSLSDFSEGQMGKLVIRKSGKAQFILGSIVLDVTMGTKCGFLQELVSVHTEGQNFEGDLSVLGHVNHRLVCTPDFESLLNG